MSKHKNWINFLIFFIKDIKSKILNEEKIHKRKKELEEIEKRRSKSNLNLKSF